MIAADSVELAFGNRDILSGCYINCEVGKVVGLLGRNGSGKSSLLKILFGSLKAKFSHLRIDDAIVKKGYTTSQIAYLPQDPFLPPFLKVKNIISTATELHQSILADFFSSIRNKRIVELSSGELRVLECVWILSQQASYVLLDEPFNGLSPVLITLIQEMIIQKKQEKGIILTDHTYLPLLEISDRIVLLHNNSVYRIDNEDDLIRYNYLPV